MERKGVVTLKGGPLNPGGAGDQAGPEGSRFQGAFPGPDTERPRRFQGQDKAHSVRSFARYAVCDTEIKRFNDEAAKVSKDVVIIFVSMDLPFAQKRFCQEFDIDKVKTLSDQQGGGFRAELRRAYQRDEALGAGDIHNRKGRHRQIRAAGKRAELSARLRRGAQGVKDRGACVIVSVKGKICVILAVAVCAMPFWPACSFAGEAQKDIEWNPVSAGPITTWSAPVCEQGKLVAQPFFFYNRTRGVFEETGHYKAIHGQGD